MIREGEGKEREGRGGGGEGRGSEGRGRKGKQVNEQRLSDGRGWRKVVQANVG
jgi:hypothetical protein